jgi:hypothetical protein
MVRVKADPILDVLARLVPALRGLVQGAQVPLVPAPPDLVLPADEAVHLVESPEVILVRVAIAPAQGEGSQHQVKKRAGM